ncbi:MAG: signal transduction histidine kinase [Paraglaciecola sp.]|jgi:signal transduction histidine kinase
MLTKLISDLSTMSLKRYLFLLIALFVIVLAGGQLLFINYIQQQISTEVADKSRMLSKQALNLLVDSIAHDDPQFVVQQRSSSQPSEKIAVVVNIFDTPNRVVDLGDGYQFVSGDRSQTIEVKAAPVKPVVEFRKDLEGRLQNFDFGRVSGSQSFSIVNRVEDATAAHIIQFSKNESAIQQYFNWLIGGTVILTILGLLLAYWLARHIGEPLGRLSEGFTDLQEGKLGSQIRPTGIQEIRETLLSFNQMSRRLAELNQFEKRFQQQQQMAELGEVARGLAHTLRNPLNTLGLAVEQISQTDMPQEERVHLAQQVRQKINHLDDTIKALLSLTTSGLRRDQRIDVNQLINDVLLEVSMTGKHNIKFSPVQNIHLTGAEVELRTMIHTLVVNAIEASPPGQVIAVFASQQAQQTFITVVDQGKGIDDAIRAELFKPHITSKPEGAGMGLYIAKRICQSYYQGDIELTDNQPQGCVASLTLVGVQSGVASDE